MNHLNLKQIISILLLQLISFSAYSAEIDLPGAEAHTVLNMIGKPAPVRGHLHIIGFITEQQSPRVKYRRADFAEPSSKPVNLPVNETLMREVAGILERAGIQETVDASGGTSYVHVEADIECTGPILCTIKTAPRATENWKSATASVQIEKDGSGVILVPGQSIKLGAGGWRMTDLQFQASGIVSQTGLPVMIEGYVFTTGNITFEYNGQTHYLLKK